jgi:hypothetical protein
VEEGFKGLEWAEGFGGLELEGVGEAGVSAVIAASGKEIAS